MIKMSVQILSYLFFLLSINQNAWGQPAAPLEFYEVETTSNEDDIILKKEIHLKNEILLEEKDSDNKITEKYYTKNDRSTFSVRGHVNENLFNSNKLLGLEAAYSVRISSLFYEVFFTAIQAQFDAITENRTIGLNTRNAVAEENYYRPGDTLQSLYNMGFGVGYRFKLHLDFFDTRKIFQTTYAYLVYHQLEESFRSERYTGFGPRLDYGLYYRWNKIVSYGLKFSYNFGIVRREGSSLERNTDKRLFLSYLTLALDLSYHF